MIKHAQAGINGAVAAKAWPAMFVIMCALAISGCASKTKLPNNAADLGIDGASGQYGSAGQYGASSGSSSYDFSGPGAGTLTQFKSVVGDVVHFNTDSASLRSDAQSILSRQAAWLKQFPNHTILLQGHADERGTRQYNLALGGRRSAAVKAFLQARGVPASRMRTISYGKEKPVATCDDMSCWSQNRRVVTVLTQ